MHATRTCRRCAGTYPLADFPRASWRGPSGERQYSHRHICRDCRTVQGKQWRHRNPGKYYAANRRRDPVRRAAHFARDAAASRQAREDTRQIVQAAIRDLRRRGMSYNAIARATGVKDQTLSRWDKLTAAPRSFKWSAVAALLDYYGRVIGAAP